jgi:hypothetical protein
LAITAAYRLAGLLPDKPESEREADIAQLAESETPTATDTQSRTVDVEVVILGAAEATVTYPSAPEPKRRQSAPRLVGATATRLN